MGKWSGDIGKIQAGKFNKAWSALTSQRNSMIELSGVIGVSEHRCGFYMPFGGGGVNAHAEKLIEGIGERHNWTVNKDTLKIIIAEIEAATIEAHANLPVKDTRITPEQDAENKAWQAKNNEERKQEQAAKADKEREEISSYASKYPHLTTIKASGKSAHACGSANIKRELAIAFPACDFSVKSSSYAGGDSIDIKWTDGPLNEEVKEITDKYEEGSFDGMTDMYDYNSDCFPRVMGGAKYVSPTREVSPARIEAVAVERGLVNPRYEFGCITVNGEKIDFDESRNIVHEAYQRSYYVAPVAGSAPVIAPVNGDGYTTRPGTRDGYVEIVFTAKPTDDIRSLLKSKGFRWAKSNGCWYGRVTSLPAQFKKTEASAFSQTSEDPSEWDDSRFTADAQEVGGL